MTRRGNISDCAYVDQGIPFVLGSIPRTEQEFGVRVDGVLIRIVEDKGKSRIAVAVERHRYVVSVAAGIHVRRHLSGHLETHGRGPTVTWLELAEFAVTWYTYVV